MTADITVLIVGGVDESIGRTMRSIAEQASPVTDVSVVARQGLGCVLNDLDSEWVAVLPAGVQLDPEWHRSLATYLDDPVVGCVGGRTIRMDGPATLAEWFDASQPLASLSLSGRPNDRLTGIPSQHVTRDVAFLRLDTMVARTGLMQSRVQAGIPFDGSPVEMSTCSLARHRGLRVVYDSALVAVFDVADEQAVTPPEEIGWFEVSRSEIVTIRLLQTPWRAWLLVAWSLVVGTRRSPVLVTGVLYAPWAGRRARWVQVMRGKVSGLSYEQA